jgi:UDP-2,3-diacylglucosamine hydrolase
MATYFISDLHLQASEPNVARGFLAFLDNLKDAEALYILGDFFEFWIGDDYSDAFTEQIKASLKQASKRYQLFFMPGNRDFMIGERFCHETGITLLPDPCKIEVEGKTLLLMHGDSLCTLDVAYMQTRQLLRNPAWQASMLEKSIDERLQFALKARRESSTQDPSMKNSEIMDVTPDEVIRVMNEAGVDLLIHGHTHRPKVHEHDLASGKGCRMVLGDWQECGWMIRAHQQHFELSQFALQP